MGDGGGGHWPWALASPDGVAPSRMVGQLIFPCTIKSRSSLLAPAHLGGTGKRAVKWLCGVPVYTAKTKIQVHKSQNTMVRKTPNKYRKCTYDC